MVVTVTTCSTTQNGAGSTSVRSAAVAGQSGAVRTSTGIAEPSAAVSSTDISPTSVPTALTPLPKPIHVSLLESDGAVYGVGMPIVAWFNRAPTNGAPFDKAVTVTVNGVPARGAWYWERSGHLGAAVEAHYRPAQYWPAHAKIRMNAPVKGQSAGVGLKYDDSLTLAMSPGSRISPLSTATPSG